MEFSVFEIGVVGGIFLVAGMVKGAIGLGLPTVSIALMGIWLVAADAAAILVLPAILTNIWQMLNGPYLVRVLKRLWPMLSALTVCTVLGSVVITGAGGRLLPVFLGSILIVYALLDLCGIGWSMSRRSEKVLSPITGAVTGVITGATAIFVIPSVPFIQALRLDKTEFIQAIAVTALLAALGLGLGLGLHGYIVPPEIIPMGIVATMTAFVGMWWGQALRTRLEVEVFRRWVLVGLVMLGSIMIVRSVT